MERGESGIFDLRLTLHDSTTLTLVMDQPGAVSLIKFLSTRHRNQIRTCKSTSSQVASRWTVNTSSFNFVPRLL